MQVLLIGGAVPVVCINVDLYVLPREYFLEHYIRKEDRLIAVRDVYILQKFVDADTTEYPIYVIDGCQNPIKLILETLSKFAGVNQPSLATRSRIPIPLSI